MKHRKISIIAAACMMYAVSAGLHSIYGILLDEIATQTGIAYASVSLAIAIGQLVFGVAQPVAGIIALKKSNTLVLVLGGMCIALGLAAIPFCTQAWMLMIFLGILLPMGTGAVSFGMIMSAITPRLGEKTAATASGLVNASSGLGSIVLSPVLQRAFAAFGMKKTLIGFSAISLLLVPAAKIVCGAVQKASSDSDEKAKVVPAIANAFRSRNFYFLLVGFFTCGFHMAIIQTHLYSQILSFGIAETTAALAFSIYGFASVAGSLLSGWLSSRFPMKYVVGTLYGSRVIWVLAFLLLPRTVPVVFAVIILLGFTGAATVTPTSGLTGKLFGIQNLATLFGIVFVSHQIGSFLSTWLGGKCFELTGGYGFIWIAAACLSLCAMIASYSIDENRRNVL